VIIPLVRPDLKTEREFGRQVALSSFFPAIFSVVMYDNEGTSIVRNEQDSRIALDRGRYRMEASIVYSHDKFFEFTSEFVVGDGAAELYWGPGSHKLLRRK
jgi:hypothetical protein